MSVTDAPITAADVRERLSKADSGNPALDRLRATIDDGTAHEQVITSYDRMHHRHNRS